MNKKQVFRVMMAIAFILAVSNSANAQLGGALNRARQAAQGATNTSVGEAVTERAAETVATATLPPEIKAAADKLNDESKRSAPAVKLLGRDTGSDIDYWFGVNREDIHKIHTEADVRAMKAAVEARTKENIEILFALYNFPAGYDSRNLFNDYTIKWPVVENKKTNEYVKVKEAAQEKGSPIFNENPLLSELNSSQYFWERAKFWLPGGSQAFRNAEGKSLEPVIKELAVGYSETKDPQDGFTKSVFRTLKNQIAPLDDVVYERLFQKYTYAKIIFHQEGAADQSDEYVIAQAAVERLIEAQANSEKLAEKAPMPASRMNDAALNAQMVQAAKSTYPDWEIMSVVIIESAWTPEHNALGQIVRRVINTQVIRKWGTRYDMMNLKYSQPYSGNGNYGATQVYAVGDIMAVDYK
jgi:hypothetical protein